MQMFYEFSKYSGCGNDFILFDNRTLKFPLHHPQIIPKLCHRVNGLGADGVILLENSTKANYKMRIFNSDGSEAEMCGNGIRCLLKFIQELGIQGYEYSIETMLKIVKVGFLDEEVYVEMGSPTGVQWNLTLSSWTVHHLDTGVPHVIIFSEAIDSLDLSVWGPQIRFHPFFAPRGANANFAQVGPHNNVHLRTYERGVEDETLACGTGATATALAAAKVYGLSSPVTVKVRSGDSLKVSFNYQNEHFTDVRLLGPAKRLFNGTQAFPLKDS